jgi:hypothetical protein
LIHLATPKSRKNVIGFIWRHPSREKTPLDLFGDTQVAKKRHWIYLAAPKSRKNVIGFIWRHPSREKTSLDLFGGTQVAKQLRPLKWI